MFIINFNCFDIFSLLVSFMIARTKIFHEICNDYRPLILSDIFLFHVFLSSLLSPLIELQIFSITFVFGIVFCQASSALSCSSSLLFLTILQIDLFCSGDAVPKKKCATSKKFVLRALLVFSSNFFYHSVYFDLVCSLFGALKACLFLHDPLNASSRYCFSATSLHHSLHLTLIQCTMFCCPVNFHLIIINL